MKIHTEILNFIIDKYNFQSYLEIGVNYDGANFNQIHVPIKDGVAPQPLMYQITSMYSDEFFRTIDENKKYDVILGEGIHINEQTYIDTQNSIKHLNEGGFILIHDCNPPDKFHARTYEEFLNNGGPWNGQAYKAFIRLKSELRDWSCFVIDEDYGCAILTPRKILKNVQLTYGIGMNNLTWETFDKNRKELLQLISYEEFEKLVDSDVEIK